MVGIDTTDAPQVAVQNMVDGVHTMHDRILHSAPNIGGGSFTFTFVRTGSHQIPRSHDQLFGELE